MKVSKKLVATGIVLSYALQGVSPVLAHTTRIVEYHNYHDRDVHHHHHHHGPDAGDAAASGFLAGTSGASAALLFSSAISRKVGAAPELIKDQAAAYFVNNEDSVLLRSAMDEFRNLLRAQGSDVDSMSYEELVELYLSATN